MMRVKSGSAGQFAILLAGTAALMLAGSAVKAQSVNRLVVWNGEDASTGAAWVNPERSTFAPQTAQAHSGSTALAFHFTGDQEWIGGGWSWYAFKTGDDVGTDTTPFKTFSFWIKTQGKPVAFRLNFLCNGKVLDTPEHHSHRVNILDYAPDVFDGQWHQVRIPLKDLVESPGFNARAVSQIQLDLSVGDKVDDTFFIDDLAFDDQPAV